MKTRPLDRTIYGFLENFLSPFFTYYFTLLTHNKQAHSEIVTLKCSKISTMDRNSPVPPAAEVAAAHRYEDSDDSDSENEEEHVENR